MLPFFKYIGGQSSFRDSVFELLYVLFLMSRSLKYGNSKIKRTQRLLNHTFCLFEDYNYYGSDY